MTFERMQATLYSPIQAHEFLGLVWRTAKPWLLLGHKLRVDVSDVKRTLPQNQNLQRLVRSIGLKIDHKDHDRLRMLLVEQWRHETGKPPQHVPSFDGQRMVDVSNRSSALDKSEGSEFIEWLNATDAQL